MPFEIVAATSPSPTENAAFSTSASPLRLEGEPHPRRERRHAREVLDVFVGGGASGAKSIDISARARETHGAFVLRDLALALVDLARRPRAKATVRLYDEPWELCIERFGATACLSLYRTGADPIVAVHDRAVPFDEVVAGARDAVVRLLGDASTTPASRVELGSALTQLES